MHVSHTERAQPTDRQQCQKLLLLLLLLLFIIVLNFGMESKHGSNKCDGECSFPGLPTT